MLFLSTILLFTLGAMQIFEARNWRRFEIKKAKLRQKAIDSLNVVKKQRGK